MSNYEFWEELSRIFNAVVAYQEKTVEFNDRFITPWIKLGNVFDKQDRNKEAVSAYRKAIAIDPSNAKNWYEMANIYFQMNDFENAVDAYNKSIELSPDSGWAYNNLALTLVSQGKYEESIPLYQTGIDLLQDNKDKAVVWNRLGNVYRKLNNYEQAVSAFHEADKLDSENAGFKDTLDDVSNGPNPVDPVILEEQSNDGVADPTQVVIENNQVLEAASQLMSQLTAEPQVTEDQVVSEELVVVEVDSVPATETVSENLTDSPTEDILVTEEVLDSVSEVMVTETVSEVSVETDAVEVLEVESPVVILDVTGEVDQAMVDDVNSESPVQAVIDEPVAEPQTKDTRSILEIVEDVIAKVLAGPAPEKAVESEPELEEVTELAVTSVDVVTEVEVETQTLTVVEQVAIDQVAVSIENNVPTITPEVPLDVVAPPAEATVPEVQADTQPQDAPVDDPNRATGQLVLDIDQDQALQLFAQNTSETFTDTLFVANPETDTSDPSLLIADKSTGDSQIVTESPDVSIAEQAAADTIKATAENVAYEEYLKDSDGNFKILGEQTDQDSLLPAELMAKIDSAGDVQIEADVKNAHVWNELGNVYFNTGAYEDAVTAYSKSIDLDRQFAWPYSNLALVYVQKGRFAEAMLLYQRSIELFSNDKDKAISWNRLGNVYRRVNDYDNAINAYQRADELDTDNATLSLQSRFSLLGNYSLEKKPSYAA